MVSGEIHIPTMGEISLDHLSNLKGCFVPTCYKDKSGYVLAEYRGKTVRLHRVIYELVNGFIPPRMVIDHLCRNRSCINPNHLELTTQRVNIFRGNAPTSINHSKTHCKYGHLLSGENLMHVNISQRRCRECHRRNNRK